MAAAGDPDAEAYAARDSCQRLSLEFSRWVGFKGYEALMSRALIEMRPAHPALKQIHYQSRPEPALVGVAESVETHGAAAVSRGIAALVEAILAMLTRLIGDDIVVTLVERSIENSARDAQDRNPNVEQGSTTS